MNGGSNEKRLLAGWVCCQVANDQWERPGGLTPSVVGFTVNPDQWCRHDRGQAWPGSSAPYRHLPHHRPPGGAWLECTRGLSRSDPGTSPLPSTPRTIRFSRPGRGRPREPSEPDGGRVSHRGEKSRSDLLLTWFLFSRFSSRCCRNVIEALSVNACLCGPALSLMLSSSREDGVWYEGLSS